MSEFRAALQEVIMAVEACTKDDDIYNAVRYNRAMSAAKALLARPEPEQTYTVNPAPDAAAPMSQGKTFTAVATYVGMPARPVPEPRITREEAMRLMYRYQDALLNIDVPMDKLNQAFEACLAAMGVSESPPAAREGGKP